MAAPKRAGILSKSSYHLIPELGIDMYRNLLEASLDIPSLSSSSSYIGIFGGMISEYYCPFIYF